MDAARLLLLTRAPNNGGHLLFFPLCFHAIIVHFEVLNFSRGSGKLKISIPVACP